MSKNLENAWKYYEYIEMIREARKKGYDRFVYQGITYVKTITYLRNSKRGEEIYVREIKKY